MGESCEVQLRQVCRRKIRSELAVKLYYVVLHLLLVQDTQEKQHVSKMKYPTSSASHGLVVQRDEGDVRTHLPLRSCM